MVKITSYLQVVRPPSSASAASATSEGCEDVTHEEILFTKRVPSAASSISTRSKSETREDVEAVLDFTEEEVQSGEYYENVVFQTGKKPKAVTENAKEQDNETYEEVLVKNVPHYENVNYSNRNEKSDVS